MGRERRGGTLQGLDYACSARPREALGMLAPPGFKDLEVRGSPSNPDLESLARPVPLCFMDFFHLLVTHHACPVWNVH